MGTHTTRQPAVAGSFYPADPDSLRTLVDQLLEAGVTTESSPKAIIAPHAGYVYSGPIAASAYARIIKDRDIIRRVILLGPSHRVAFYGLAASSAEAFTTPLGRIPVDSMAMKNILALPQLQILDRAHAFEHSLEVHLPFLQRALRAFSIVPLLVGDATAEEVSEVLDKLWGGPETLIVISSDLSHYRDYNSAKSLDLATSRAIEMLQPQNIDYEQACGRNPIIGLLNAAQRHGLKAKTIDLRNSGDIAGLRDRVVGYGAYIFE